MVKNPLHPLVLRCRWVENSHGSVLGLLRWVIVLALAAGPSYGQSIGTAAGDGATSILNSPSDVFVNAGDTIYVADRDNHRIRMVFSNAISTIAGTGTAGFLGDNGQAANARFNSPVSVFVDGVGRMYIADRDNHRIRRVSTSGVITTIAGTGEAGFLGDNGAATSARLNSPTGIFVDDNGILYIADRGNHRIRKVTAAGTISTVAGTGIAGCSGDGAVATSAQLSSPADVFVDADGNVNIADRDNHRIRRISSSGIISTIAGNGTVGFFGDGGPATATSLAFPTSVWSDTSGSVYIADQFNQRVRRILADSTITTVAGSGEFSFSGDDGLASVAALKNPVGVFGTANGNIYIADSGNHRIRLVTPIQESTPAAGLSDSTAVAAGGETEIFSIGILGDGLNGVMGLGLRISDLTTGTGLLPGDISALKLYRSADASLDPSDELIGSLAPIELDSLNTITIPGLDIPGNQVEQFYIVSALMDTVVTEGHAFRVAFPAQGVSTTLGSLGSAVIAADTARVTVDVVADRLVFTREPGGSISGVPLITQPIVAAMDAYGNIDTSFADTLTLSESSAGSLQSFTATPDSGWVAFTDLIYWAADDDEVFVLSVDDQTGGSEGDLPPSLSNAVLSNMFNDPPRVYLPPLIIDEDASFTVLVTNIVTDPDDTLFTWQFISDHIDGTVADGEVTLTPELNWAGVDTLTIVVTDSHGAQGSGRLWVEVRPRDDPPGLSFPDTLYADEDDTLRIPLQEYVADPETPVADLYLLLTVSAGLSQRRVGPDTLELWAPADSSGHFRMTALVRDPTGLTARDTTTISIRPVNSPPVMAIADTTIQQDSRLSLFLPDYTHDPDDPVSTLIWSAPPGLHLSVTVDATGWATIVPDSAWYGVEQVVIAVRDPAGATVADMVLIEVEQENRPPTLTSLPDTSLSKGDTLSLNLLAHVSDPDDSTTALQWQVSGAPQDQATIEGGVLTFVASFEPAHTGTLVVRATDPGGRSATQPMYVTILNQAPQLQGLPDLELIQDTPDSLDLDPYVTDDGSPEELTVSAPSDSGLVISLVPATRILVLRSLPGWSGQWQVAVLVRDAEGASVADTLRVAVASGGDPPVEPRSADFDGNGTVDLTDFFGFADHFGLASDDPGWDPVYDIDRDGKTGFADFFLFADEYSPAPPEEQVQVGSIPDVSFALNEIFTLSLDDYLVAGTPAEVTWTVSAGVLTRVTIAPTSHRATLSGVQAGQEELTFTARGPGGYTDSETVRVTVLPTESPPASFDIQMPESISVRRGHSAALDLDNYVTEAQFPVEEVVWTASATSGILISIRNRTAFVGAETGSPDTGSVAFTATSPQGEGITRTVQVRVQ